MNLAQLIDLAEMATVRRALRASAHSKAQCSAALSTQAGTLSWCLQSSLHHSLAARSAECARRTSSCGRSAMLRRRSPRCSATRCRRRHVVGRLRCCCCKVLCASWLHPPSSCAARVNSPTAALLGPTVCAPLGTTVCACLPANLPQHCTALHCTAQHSTAQHSPPYSATTPAVCNCRRRCTTAEYRRGMCAVVPPLFVALHVSIRENSDWRLIGRSRSASTVRCISRNVCVSLVCLWCCVSVRCPHCIH